MRGEEVEPFGVDGGIVGWGDRGQFLCEFASSGGFGVEVGRVGCWATDGIVWMAGHGGNVVVERGG